VRKDSTLYEEDDDIYGMYFQASENMDTADKGSIGFVLQKYNNVKYVELDKGISFGVIDIVHSIIS
jgi:hypothetical protein